MAFPPDFLEEIKARLPLGEWIGRSVALKRRGQEQVGLCPFHKEKTPSFHVNEAKGIFKCFGCGEGGSLFDFAMKTESLSFPEAVERLAAAAGLALPERDPREAQRREREDPLRAVLEAAAQWYARNLKGEQGLAARRYIEERGLAPATVERFRLGYAPNQRGALRAALNAQGLKDEALIEAGLLKADPGGAAPRDYLFDRLVFPIEDRRGRIVAFGGRTLGGSDIKYLNTPESPLFHKGRQLYNLAKAEKAARDTGELIVVEGYMDVIALDQAGFPAVVAPLGTAVTEEQIGQMWRLTAEPILCLDGDEAGRRAAGRAAERALPLLKPGKSLRFAFLPQGEDPDSLVRAEGPSALRRALEAAVPLVRLVWDLACREALGAGGKADTPERRAAVLAAARGLAQRVGDADLRQLYRQELEGRHAETFGGRRRSARERPGGGFPAGGRRKERQTLDLGTLKRLSDGARTMRRRSEALLLALLVEHPALALEFAEALVESFENRDLEALRARLLDWVAETPPEGLDTNHLKCHLTKAGVGPIVNEILDPSVYIETVLARPGGSEEEARAAVNLLLDRRKETQRASAEAIRLAEQRRRLTGGVG